MSVDEKLDQTILISLIEDELEERKYNTDRRQKHCEETMKKLTEQDRRTNADRRAENA